MKKLLPVILLATMSLSSCVITTNNAQVGGVGGAAGGAILGQAIGKSKEATMIGAGVGLLLGYLVGNEMDKVDQVKLSKAIATTPTGQTTGWENPDTHNQFKVTPTTRPYKTASNQTCKQADITAIIDGKPTTTHTRACKNQQGQWILKG